MSPAAFSKKLREKSPIRLNDFASKKVSHSYYTSKISVSVPIVLAYGARGGSEACWLFVLLINGSTGALEAVI